ncbi:hypothetical protein [Deinococcus hopiensis]|uniref:CHAT domain-containing protein n=1 Tax=Deinococcus hopiensis KR-140 TaxID=695939 RepID=A0A1W1VEY5_9DEIO|nr:hypothetical protein [Deinococcus hopiensis]SMB91621.1 hypothetical protein SAMN00790413_01219 [Deinococcus hopiensis KR-140]
MRGTADETPHHRHVRHRQDLRHRAAGPARLHGHRTDTDEWGAWATHPGGSTPDWVWREDRSRQLLTAPRAASLVLSGCKTNQGQFYGLLDAVVLLSAPVPVILERLAARTNNP